MHSMCYRDIVPRVQTTSNFDVQHQIAGPGGQETKKPQILQHATNTNETKETYNGNMCKHMEHLEPYKYETLWNHVKRNNHNMENENHLYYQCWRQKLLSYLYPVRKHGWVMSGDHPFAMIAPPGRRGVFSQHRCMSLKFFVLTIGASFRSGWKIIASVAVARAHTRVFQAQSRLPSNLLSFTPPRRRFLPWASPPSGEVSFIPLWPSFMRCSLSFESIVIFKFLRWSYTLPIFLKFLRRNDGKGPLKPVILNHILQRAKHRWSSIFWDRNLRITSGICFCSLPPNSLKFEDEVQHLSLGPLRIHQKKNTASKNVLKFQWPLRLKISINNLYIYACQLKVVASSRPRWPMSIKWPSIPTLPDNARLPCKLQVSLKSWP